MQVHTDSLLLYYGERTPLVAEKITLTHCSKLNLESTYLINTERVNYIIWFQRVCKANETIIPFQNISYTVNKLMTEIRKLVLYQFIIVWSRHLKWEETKLLIYQTRVVLQSGILTETFLE